MLGRTMARAVSRGPVNSEARIKSQANLYGIYGGKSNMGAGLSPSNLVFPCQHHSTGALCELIRLSRTLYDISN
jgi:hypothetical protein